MAEQVRPESHADRGARSGSPFRVIKPGQGRWVRGGTAAGAAALSIACAAFVQDVARGFTDEYLIYTLVPVAVLVVLAYLVYWCVGRNATIVDFLIATEGEMKKVNWSSRREVWGATRVVIFTVIALAFILFFVDIIFMLFFSSLGVLRINVLERFFGGGS